jgi:hypothetical protein
MNSLYFGGFMFLKLIVLGAVATFAATITFAQTQEPKKGVGAAVWMVNEGGYLGVQTTEITKENLAHSACAKFVVSQLKK